MIQNFLSSNDYLLRQCEASLARSLRIPPPVGHQHDLASSEEQEDKQHAEVEASVKRRRQDVVPPRPKRIPVTVRPKHHHKSSDETACHSRADVAPEVRHCAEEDRCVPELEFRSWEKSVEGVYYKGSDCPQYEAERKITIDMLIE